MQRVYRRADLHRVLQPWARSYFPARKYALRVTDADDLLRPARFDVAMKHRFIRDDVRGVSRWYALELYREHLRVWNAFHEMAPPKQGFEEYLRSFRALDHEFATRGYAVEHGALPIDARGTLIDGGHRAAVCIHRRLPAWTVHSRRSIGPYNAAFFRQCGLDDEWLDAGALEYLLLRPTTRICVAYPSSAGEWLRCLALLETSSSIVYAKQRRLGGQGQVGLVRALYEGETWLGKAPAYLGAAEKARLSFRCTGTAVFVLLDELEVSAKSIKEEIRGGSESRRHLVHITDTHEESVRLGRVVFNERSLDFLEIARPTPLKRFDRLLRRFRRLVREDPLVYGEACIDGSAVLSAHGLRDCADLDIILPSDGVAPHTPVRGVHVREERDRGREERDALLYDPRRYFHAQNGIQFVTLDEVAAHKRERDEPKDRVDLGLVARARDAAVMQRGWPRPSGLPWRN